MCNPGSNLVVGSDVVQAACSPVPVIQKGQYFSRICSNAASINSIGNPDYTISNCSNPSIQFGQYTVYFKNCLNIVFNAYN